ncbi:glycosyltransferase family 4 protein [Pseudomonas sp. 5Ae-yellow]|uniref:glycosyltransferase family 4 protein n=1 Tax=Pseudomonas sp. 5Ae-yellow TaxID=2759848 RepID=UPI0015F3D309|nr:glycosyltransferase family 4 protein [Pseudomonas sp. 5Ae-yellow]MBA6420245.1 glycosyltransferase family 4 protein [Pseudomonas sp. 5Ae-yellow]
MVEINALASRFLLVAGFSDSLINFRGPLVEALVDAGLEVHAAAPDLTSNAAIASKLSGWGVTCHDVALQRAGVNPVADLKGLIRLYFLIRHIQPDVVLGYTIKPVIYGILAAWFARVPHRFALITGLGYAFTGEATGKRKVIQQMARSLYSLALARAEKVFFQNPDDQALFSQLGLISKHSSSAVLNGSGIDLAHFQQRPLTREPVAFLLIARLLGDKGVREYVAAARKVKKENPEVVFQLVGSVDENPDSVRLDEVQAWQKGGTIEYLGRKEDVRVAIERCSVYVLPSYREGTPRTVLEAMAMGRAIITTDAPGCRETVVDGDNGFLVPVKSVDALVEAMTRFIEDPDLAVRMGKRSREIAVEKYDVHKVNAVMLKEMGIQ